MQNCEIAIQCIITLVEMMIQRESSTTKNFKSEHIWQINTEPEGQERANYAFIPTKNQINKHLEGAID